MNMEVMNNEVSPGRWLGHLVAAGAHAHTTPHTPLPGMAVTSPLPGSVPFHHLVLLTVNENIISDGVGGEVEEGGKGRRGQTIPEEGNFATLLASAGRREGGGGSSA